MSENVPKKRVRSCGITNTAGIKKYCFDVLADKGRTQFTQISKEFTDRAEAHLRSWIRNELHMHPAMGKTIR